MSALEIVGLVFAAECPDLLALDDQDAAFDTLAERFKALGFHVQAVSLHIDGLYRIEVLS